MNLSSHAAVPPADNRRGAAWMLLSAVLFATAAVVIKLVGARVPVQEMVFFRCFFGLSVIFPFVWRHGLGIFRTRRVDLHITRVLCAMLSMNFGFYALTHLELATATALTFTRPLFMILLAIMFLGEVIRWRRGLATALGFLGVVLMLDPERISGTAVNLAFGAGLGAAFFVAGAMAVVRQQAAADGPATIMSWFATGTTVLSAIPAALVWQTPSWPDLGLLVALGILSSLGQFCMIKAFTIGEATVVNPIDYTQIILAAVFGYFLFGELPNLWTWVGMAVIVGSTLYIIFREAKVKHTPPPPPLKEG